MKPFLIIQNDAYEGAGLLMTLINQRKLKSIIMSGWDARYKDITTNDYCALIILGGAQGVYETDQYPYLLDEIKLAKNFIDEDKPVTGLCLGAQILASALGGEVLQNTQKELGWFEIELSEQALQDELMRSQPKTALAYHFHGDYFKLPPECISLARSEKTECQLFRYKQNVYGFQYHAEVDLPLIEVMCRNNKAYMQSNGYQADKVIAESEKYIVDYQLRCSSVLNNWINLSEI